MFRRILLPTDYSENARSAYRWAIELARLSGGRIVMIHVLEDALATAAPLLGLPTPAELVDMSRYREDFRRAAESALEETAEGLRAQGVAVETQIVEGGRRPSEAIVRAAKDFECGVIVIATHGRGGLAHLLIGSTAERVVRTAHCPVLTVHGPAE